MKFKTDFHKTTLEMYATHADSSILEEQNNISINRSVQ